MISYSRILNTFIIHKYPLKYGSCIDGFVFQIEEALVQRKKMELLQQYTSDTLKAETDQSKELMGL